METATAFNVVELRRYVMKPGRRDDLIALFEREFIESQERCGMVPVGHYRDLDDPDRFVWFRGFADMETRRGALEAFYLRSPEWLENRDAANDTMVDSDDVLLLRPARPESGFDLHGLQRPPHAAARAVPSYVGVAVFMLERAADASAVDAFEREALADLRHTARRVAYFVTDDRPNDFPRLPVREGEAAFVVTGVCEKREDLAAWIERLRPGRLPEPLQDALTAAEYLRLEPAARSLLC
jgi:hypothetical protein